MPLRFALDRLIVIVAIIAIVSSGAFLLALIVPTLFFHSTVPSAYIFDVRVALFIVAVVTLFGLGPYIIYQFQQKVRLQNAISHYVRNKMQEIMLAIDLVEANLLQADTEIMTYKEKVELLEEVRVICQDVAGNLTEKILAEAPKFRHDLASKKA